MADKVRPQIKSTKSLESNFLNMLIYGRAGVGKTVSLGTAPKPLILSAEAGMLSLLSMDIPYVTIRSIADLRDVYTWLLTSPEADQYQTVCIDSISEVCDIAFVECKKRVGSSIPTLYSELRTTVLPLLSAFRNLPKHIVATARETTKQTKNEVIVGPAMVGNKLTDDLPYLYDVVLHYTIDESNNRVCYTNSSCGSIAKDRTGLLPDEIRGMDNLVNGIINSIGGK